MKKQKFGFAVLVAALLSQGFLSGETRVVLKGLHLCCKGCVTAAVKAVKSAGAESAAQPQQRTLVIEAPDEATAKKAVEAVAKAGYYGKSDKPSISIGLGVDDAKVTSAIVTGVHLCCGKCVRAVDKAVEAVKGAGDHTAEKKAKTFKVTGNFSLKELAEALHEVGLHGTISK